MHTTTDAHGNKAEARAYKTGLRVARINGCPTCYTRVYPGRVQWADGTINDALIEYNMSTRLVVKGGEVSMSSVHVCDTRRIKES